MIVGAVGGSDEAGALAAVSGGFSRCTSRAAFSTQTFPAWRRPHPMRLRAGSFDRFGSCACSWSCDWGRGRVTAPWLVEVLLAVTHEKSAVLLQASAIAGVPVLLTQPLATFLQARGLERPVAVATTVGDRVLSPLRPLFAACDWGDRGAGLSSGLRACAVVLAALVWLFNRSPITPWFRPSRRPVPAGGSRGRTHG